MISISSKENKIYKYLKSLQQKKYRDKENIFYTEGFVVLKEALKYKNPKYIAISESKVLELEKLNIETQIYVIADKIFKGISDTVNSQGVIAYFEQIHNFGIENIKAGKYILLDDVRDPGNVGGLIRSADGFGVKLIMTPECVELYNPKLIRSTMTSIFRVEIHILNNKAEIESLRERGFEIVATDVDGGEISKDFNFRENTILILGNEAKGVSNEMLNLSERKIYIQTQNIESLNVNVAGSILMYEMMR
ncbi:RNA methyltransferase, TrmH family [Peptoniphilus asaccharolyticus DSM 20463]|uniref:RNA methyltransferase, TrmH family n=1 Tax=Peptoniphilus asaccharolyticus DSM 20463 TaxID=573058 RepID=A0A1W1UVQ2_PEPAS|nr:RNA methyltransferase [Peptoniphilus asaccharolyticus]MBL7575251.1 RNA methyltransferase [Peptoniphilus asaccharolyticus]SMB85069.1 RNA methyltransferase, TrmH family [Peptoniphilus asaccharolyticus DSM 20463]